MKRNRLAALALALVLLAGCGWNTVPAPSDDAGQARAALFRTKAEALRSAALADWVREELGESPAGDAGYVVFLSACDTVERARVFSGTGDTLDAAWDTAASAAEAAIRDKGPAPVWLKADLVYISETIPADWLGNIGEAFGIGGFRYGLALDPGYQTAVLEAELNSAGIYDYEHGGLHLERLNSYLEGGGRAALASLPEQYTAFQCAGWFCGEDGGVCQLSPDNLDYGRREMGTVSGDTARALVLDGAEYLAAQAADDEAWEQLSAADRARVLSAMIRGYELSSNETLAGAIDQAAGRILAETAYAESGPAFVLDGDEITLEGCALSLIALADCMEASGSTAYLPACEALGAGILSLLNTETGTFTHVLNAASLERKEAFRSPAWDGMGVTALCRLYGLTQDSLWLWSARQVLERMAAEDYAQYGEAWTSYAVREFTKHERDQTDCFILALKNAQRNLADIYGAQTTSPQGLELLMASYEAYRQMAEAGYSSSGFELELVLRTVQARAARQLDGYLFPEYAMYMETPRQVLGAFMTREEGLRIVPGEVCRNIYGYYLYAVNYDALASDGLPAGG